MVSSKVRIYDLAKELKLDSKRLIEEVRREGIDVSVPSNSVSKELADKIRGKYFPKKEQVAARTIRVVKKAARPAGEDEAIAPAFDETDQYDEAELRADAPSTAPAAESAPRPLAPRIVKKLAPAARAEQPGATDERTSADYSPEVEGFDAASSAPAQGSSTTAETQTPLMSSSSAVAPAISESPANSSPATAETRPADASATGAARTTVTALRPAPQPPASSAIAEEAPTTAPGATSGSAPVPGAMRQIRVLRPTAAALSAGIRHGERAPEVPRPQVIAPQPNAPGGGAAPASPRDRDRRGGGSDRPGGRPTFDARSERMGTPGETATPQTTYIPPPDAHKRRSRSGGARGGSAAGAGNRRPGDNRGRYEKDYTPPPRALSLEDRIAGTLNMGAGAANELKPVRLVEGSTVKEFAEKLGIKPKDIVSLLLQRGVFATINQPLNDDSAIDLGRRFGYEVSFVPFEEMVAEEEFEELIAADVDDVELPRAPVVTVMGHVDHGKTSLLDAIRATDVAAGEAGGITQHIGAYSVQVPNPDNPGEKRRVVFLDTPGHEAFTMMRSRGAKATDVVVLVVAADDGVMPQTIEAIEHARAAKVPIVVAINKIDKPDANPDRVKQELSVQGLQPIAWGGETEMVEVSAKKRENLDALLETILLTADILNLRASSTRLASGVVLEAKLDRGRGSVATVLVQQGTLHGGDPFIVGQVFGKVRALFNDRGEPVTEVGPATPVEVLGLQGVPQAGESFQVVADVSRAQQISHHRQMVTRQNTLLQTTRRGIEALGQKEIKELLVILKADVQGSAEVLKSTLQKLSTERVKVKVIRSGVGAITESDVLLASATQASDSSTAVVIIGFNVRPEVRAADLAKQESVDVRLHSIIYKVEEEVRAAMLGMLEAVEKERILGRADVREVFRVPRLGAVAGCMITNGIVRRTGRARLIRDSVVIWEGGVASLRRFKEDVGEVREGFECGIGLENYNDIKVGDQIEAFIIEKVAATEL